MAKEEQCHERHARALSGAERRRHSNAKKRLAKEEQRNERLREGLATNRYAEALGSSARTGRERRRHRDAEQCYAGRRRSKAAACDGDGLIRAAKALLCGA